MSRVRWSLAGVLSLFVYSACSSPPVVLPEDSLGETTVGAAYTRTIVATGGSTRLAYAATGLPPGLSMSSSGTISGAATAPGDFSVMVTATAEPTETASRTYPLKVFPAPTLGPATLPDGTLGAAYSATLTASGGKPPLAMLLTSGALPAGLSFSGATGSITGTPTATGTSTFTIEVRESFGATASQTYTVTVSTALSMTVNVPASGNVGTAFTGFAAAQGGRAPLTYSVTSGLLPPGLGLSASTGLFSGTPTFAGRYTFTVAATDANGIAVTQAVTIDVFNNAPPAVVTSSVPNGVVGSSYLATLVAQYGRPPYTWSLGSGSLPPGLALSASGQISGTPTTPGNNTFQVVATDANGQAAQVNLAIAVYTSLAIGTASLPEGYTTQAYSGTTLSASGGQAPYSWALSGALPPGLTFTPSSATLFGTPDPGSAGSYGVTFTVTDSAGQSRSASFTLTIYALPQVATTTLADGVVGASYSQVLQASGGKAPLSWMITTGSLPTGLSLDAGTGAILGTPSAAGTSSFAVQVTDATGKTASRVLGIAVYAGLAITSGPPPDGYTGTAYSRTLTATGGLTPYTWSLAAGALPAGITLNASTGALGGTPTATGTSTFTVRVTDANSQTATKQFSLTIYAPPAITTAALPDGYVGQLYASFSLQGSGGKAPYTYAVTAGTLPPGLSLSAAGVLSGTPTAASAPTSITVTLTDQNGRTATRAFTFGTYALPSISTNALADGYTGVAYSRNVTTSGTGKLPIAWSVVSGTLPAGLTLAGSGTQQDTGVISGTPTATGTSTFTVQAQDANGRIATASLSIAVFAPPAIVTTSLADGTLNVAYSAALVSSGGKSPFTWSVTSGALPPGISLSASSGAISGTPTTAGAYSFTVQLSDANGRTASRALTLTVYGALFISTASPLPTGEQGTPYSQTIRAAGGRQPVSFSLSAGALPPGMSQSAAPPDGTTVSGPPSASGTFSFTLTATDSTTPTPQTASKVFQITVAAPVAITTAALSDGYVGLAYSDAVAATNGVPPYRYTVSAGALPAGLLLNQDTGALTGTPTAASTTTVTLTATDALSQTASRSYTMAVYAVPSITTASPLPDAYQGTAFSLTLVGANGKAPYAWSLASGTLPAGLSLSASGVLSGTPTATATSSFSIRLTDANGQTATKAFTQAVLSPVAITTTSVPEGYVGITYPATTIAGSGGKTPYSFAVTAGALPAGLSLSSSTGAISGTPSAAQSGASFTVTLTDANGVAAQRSYTTNIYTQPAISTSAIPDAYSGSAYTTTLMGAGGKTPHSWTLTSGALPAGLSLSPGGVISGTTTATGTYSITVTLTDANGRTATRALTLAVLSGLAVTTNALADGYLTVAYSRTLSATGGLAPYTWAISAGALPAGLSLSATGVISGTPTATGTASFTVRVTDANSSPATRALSITVYALPSVSTGTLADAYLGSAYNAPLAGAGGKTPYSFAVTSGALPAGLTLASGGAITGTPTGSTTGSASFTVTLTDANGMAAARAFNLSVLPALSVATGALADGYTGLTYSQVLAAAGGKTPYSWSSGALPAGLTLNAGTGAITGTPTATGNTSFVITVRDANNVTASLALTITVYTQPSVTAATLPDAYPAVGYSATISGTGGKTPYAFAVTAGTFPAGLSLSGAGLITGNTTAPPGGTNFTVTLTDANGVTASRPFSIAVLADLMVTTSSLPDAYAAATYSQTLTAAGGRGPFTWAISSGQLPGGVSLSAGTGAISGTPAAPGNALFTAQVTDSNGVRATRTLTIQTYALPSITTTLLAEAVSLQSYEQVISVSGGRPPYSWSQSGALPVGISFSNGTFSGAANSVADYPGISVTVIDANGRSSTQPNYTLRVVNAVAVTTGTVNDAYVGSPFSQQLTAAGGTGPYSFSVTGSLPPGLSMNGGGLISGTPTTSGTFTYTVTAQDSMSRSGNRTFTHSVWLQPSIVTPALPDGYIDQTYSAALVGSGGRAPYVWSFASGLPPSGIFLDEGGTFSGQCTSPTTASFTVRLTDANGRTVTRALSIAVLAPPSQTSPATLADGYLTQGYNVTLGVTGGRTPFTWTAGGGLPPGITLSTAGVLSGTPTAAGAYSFSVTATDANGRTAVMSHAIGVFALPSITTPSTLPDGYRGVSYNFTLVASGGAAPLTWTVTGGALPSSLFLEASTAALYGIPTISGSFSATITVTDRSGRTASKAFSITIQPPLSITTVTLPEATLGRPYSAAMSATGGHPPYTWLVTSSSPPPGITMSSSGVFSGTPTSGVGSSFVVQVVDQETSTATQSVTIQVNPGSLWIATDALATATEGIEYSSERIVAGGGRAPLKYQASGLPAGISIDDATGALSGIPARGTAGVHSVKLTVTDASERQRTRVVDLRVEPARTVRDVLTVFTTDVEGRPYPDMAVRLRRNGAEYVPVKEQITDADGKTVFTGLGLNGVTDTVDVTVNGVGVANASVLGVNAAMVTIPLLDYPVPLPRAYASGQLDPRSGQLIVTGGHNPLLFGGTPVPSALRGGCQNDLLRVTDPVEGTWSEELPPGMASAPSLRFHSGMAYAGGSHVLFGGRDCSSSAALDDVWLYDAASAIWTRPVTSGTTPPARSQMAMAGVGSSVLIFGGEAGAALDDLYSFEPGSGSWTALSARGSRPAVRYNARAVGVRASFWMCGGADGSRQLADCWSYASGAWTRRPALPSAREGFGMAATEAGSIYVFGGRSGTETLNDLWMLKGDAWERVTATNPPPAREGAVLAYESNTGRLLLFGGQDGTAYFSDLWSFDPESGAWTQRAKTWSKPGSEYVPWADRPAFDLARGPAGIAFDWAVFAREIAEPSTVVLPLPSTLRPARPTPAGQEVWWR